MFNKSDSKLAVISLIVFAMSVPGWSLVVRSSVNGIEMDSGGFSGINANMNHEWKLGLIRYPLGYSYRLYP